MRRSLIFNSTIKEDLVKIKKKHTRSHIQILAYMNKTLPVYIIKETAIIDDLIRFDIFFLSKNILNNCEFKKNMQNTYSFIEDKENLNIFNKMITNLSEHEK
jgi:hypothetical protein